MDARLDARRIPVLDEDRLAQLVVAAAVVLLCVFDAALITRGHVLAGAIGDGALLLVLLNLAAWYRPAGGADARAMHALALAALARVVAVGMPVSDMSEPVAQLLVALPVGYAAIRFARVVGVSVRGLVAAPPVRPAATVRADACVVIVGAGLGLLAYLLGAPALATQDSSPGRILLAAAAVTATVVVEELVFRGLLQTALQRVAGRAGFVAATALFACAYLGAGSAAVVLTMALGGLVFAYGYAQSGNLRSAAVSHYHLALGAFVVWPVLFGRSSLGLDGPAPPVLLALVAVAGVAAVLRRPLPSGP